MACLTGSATRTCKYRFSSKPCRPSLISSCAGGLIRELQRVESVSVLHVDEIGFLACVEMSPEHQQHRQSELADIAENLRANFGCSGRFGSSLRSGNGSRSLLEPAHK